MADTSSLDRDVVYVEWNRTDGTRNQDFVAELRPRIKPSSTKTAKCPHCQKNFATKYTRDTHVKKFHSGETGT